VLRSRRLPRRIVPVGRGRGGPGRGPLASAPAGCRIRAAFPADGQARKGKRQSELPCSEIDTRPGDVVQIHLEGSAANVLLLDPELRELQAGTTTSTSAATSRCLRRSSAPRGRATGKNVVIDLGGEGQVNGLRVRRHLEEGLREGEGQGEAEEGEVGSPPGGRGSARERRSGADRLGGPGVHAEGLADREAGTQAISPRARTSGIAFALAAGTFRPEESWSCGSALQAGAERSPGTARADLEIEPLRPQRARRLLRGGKRRAARRHSRCTSGAAPLEYGPASGIPLPGNPVRVAEGRWRRPVRAEPEERPRLSPPAVRRAGPPRPPLSWTRRRGLDVAAGERAARAGPLEGAP